MYKMVVISHQGTDEKMVNIGQMDMFHRHTGERLEGVTSNRFNKGFKRDAQAHADITDYYLLMKMKTAGCD